MTILGGRPKNIYEEDMSARFLGNFRIGVTDFVNNFFVRGRSGGGSAPLFSLGKDKSSITINMSRTNQIRCC